MPKKWKTEQLPARTESSPAPARETDLFVAEIGESVPQIDLHGMRVDEARSEIETFINAMFARGEKSARIVHGRGSGQLQREVHQLLTEYQRRGLVETFRNAQHKNQMGGVTVFALHRPDQS